jgi:3-methylcrotonyl-CoA carboxylase alpha subunit
MASSGCEERALFTKVLIANRGEIAARIIRTLRSLGIASVAVYSDADAGARHVLEADEAIRIGPAAAAASYLNIDAIVSAAAGAGAEAVHPGYGFLAENAALARSCAAAGLTFIGPPPEAIEAMGDKIAAKALVAAAGVPVVPGTGRPGMSDEELIREIAVQNDPWAPVLIKPSAGGGGKGMRVVSSAVELPDALAAARRTAIAAFGDGTLLVERYVPRPRHIEIQVLADTWGNVVHLGERECSLQRRHQKIIEEAPSPFLDAARRQAMGAAAAAAARSAGYVGAGTVEFIVPGDAAVPGQGVPGEGDVPRGADGFEYFFMEMNTRLQVEHPVTELVYGLDLVEWQLRVAAGQPLPFAQEDLRPSGHAIEARIYAEDPARGFLPTGGTVLALREPAGPGVRVDSGLDTGVTVTSDYDPMLAKVIASGPDRATALRRLDAALADTVVLGVTTNTGFLRGLLADPDVQSGHLDTGLVERTGSGAGIPPSAETLAAAALSLALARESAGPVTGPWDIPDGWRVGERAWIRFRLSHGPAETTEVRVRGLASAGAQVAVGDGEPVPARAEFRPASGTIRGGGLASSGTRPWPDDGPGGARARRGSAVAVDLVLTYRGRTVRFAYAADRDTTWLAREGRAWAVREEQAASPRGRRPGTSDGTVRSPMPGAVIAVNAAVGQAVTAGQPLLVVEAMKMEHTVTAPMDGTVTELAAKPGKQVRMDEPLAVIGQEPGHGAP